MKNTVQNYNIMYKNQSNFAKIGWYRRKKVSIYGENEAEISIQASSVMSLF